VRLFTVRWGSSQESRGEALSDTDRLPAAQPGRAYVIVEPVADHYRLGKRTAGALQGQLEDLRVGCLNGANLYHAQKRPNPTSALESQPRGGRGQCVPRFRNLDLLDTLPIRCLQYPSRARGRPEYR
jgi:hypothetical protein